MRLEIRFPAELLRSPHLRRVLEAEAQAIGRAAGPGMIVDSQAGSRRARASVRTGTVHAMRRQARYQVLSRALGSRRR